MTDVFISYARRDSEVFAQQLTRALEAAELDVWVDLEDIPAASDWQRDLSEGVLASEYVCFVISPASVASEHCLEELRQAVDRNKRLVPIIHRAVPDDQVPEPLRRLNWIPQRGLFEDDFDRHAETTVAAVRTDLDRLREHTRWEQRASEWEARGRDSSLLARGSEMREAEDWLAAQAGAEPPPTSRQIEFVNTSRRASSRRQRLILAASLMALAISVGLGIATLIERNHARDERDLARSNELASAANASLEIDPERSLILAVAAAQTKPTERSEQALAQAISASNARAQIDLGAKPYQARLSPNNRWMVAGTENGADLYDVQTDKLVRNLYDGGAVYDLVFDPDSSGVWIAGEDGDLRHYALPDGDLDQRIPMPDGTSSIAISARSILIAATTTSGQVRVFDSNGDRFQTLRGHDGPVVTVDFAEHGAGLISAGLDGTVRVWNAATGDQIGLLEGHANHYRDADLTSNGHTAVTVARGGDVRVWDVLTGKPEGNPLNDPIREGRANSVDLSPDERSALVSFDDGRARTFLLQGHKEQETFGRQSGAARSAEYGGAGRSIVTTGLSDHSARIYDAGTLRHAFPGSGYVYATAVSPDDAEVAVAGTDGSLQLYDRASGEPKKSWSASPRRLRTVNYSASGDRLVTGGDAGVARVWDAGSGDPVGPALRQGGAITGADFDPTGDFVATGGLDGIAWIWNLQTGDRDPIGSGDYINALDWSPDGKLIAMAVQRFRTDTIRVVDSQTRETVTKEWEVPGGATSLSFDPAGKRLVVGSEDGGVRIYEATTGRELVSLNGQLGQVNSAQFSADGGRVITTGPQGTRVWSAESGLSLSSYPQSSVYATPTRSGSIVIGYRAVRPVELHDCEACSANLDELLELAERRITREPTAGEAQQYGL